MSDASVLLLDDGGLPTLTAALLQPATASVRFWSGRFDHEAAPDATRTSLRHEALLPVAYDQVNLGPIQRHASQSDWVRVEGQRLFRAAGDALAAGIDRVVWPFVVGTDLNDATLALELAAAIADTVTVGIAGVDALVIDAPFVDRTWWEIVDLASDIGVPMHLAEVCDRFASPPCEACSGCRRWQKAFEQAAIDWPWSAVPVTAGTA
ncbi:MAG: 7-cyano-7-deazaguanine synthase [Planctomycetota bacterium]